LGWAATAKKAAEQADGSSYQQQYRGANQMLATRSNLIIQQQQQQHQQQQQQQQELELQQDARKRKRKLVSFFGLPYW